MAADAAVPASSPQVQAPARDRIPRSVFLFSGHMIDAPDRAVARFPAHAVPIAERALAARLEQLQAGPQDLAICGGACGGDLLFAEAALRRGARLELYLPFHEEAFLASSVDFAGRDWHRRFQQVKARAVVQVLAADPGRSPSGRDPYEANNRRMLDQALAFGAARMHFICLWNGAGGDGPGGTAHMMREVQRLGGEVHWLDTRSLWD